MSESLLAKRETKAWEREEAGDWGGQLGKGQFKHGGRKRLKIKKKTGGRREVNHHSVLGVGGSKRKKKKSGSEALAQYDVSIKSGGGGRWGQP